MRNVNLPASVWMLYWQGAGSSTALAITGILLCGRLRPSPSTNLGCSGRLYEGLWHATSVNVSVKMSASSECRCRCSRWLMEGKKVGRVGQVSREWDYIHPENVQLYWYVMKGDNFTLLIVLKHWPQSIAKTSAAGVPVDQNFHFRF